MKPMTKLEIWLVMEALARGESMRSIRMRTGRKAYTIQRIRDAQPVHV